MAANGAEVPATDAEPAPGAEHDGPAEAPAWRPGRRSEPERGYQPTPEEQRRRDDLNRQGRRFISGYAFNDADGGDR